jgi:Domain of unknown function (DUF3291)
VGIGGLRKSLENPQLVCPAMWIRLCSLGSFGVLHTMPSMRRLGVPVLLLLSAPYLRSQNNYEIQVYAYDQVEPHHTMVELHSNFTINGSKTVENGVLPTNHAEHETIEITHGFTDWFETGFYIFTYARNGNGVQWVYKSNHAKVFRDRADWFEKMEKPNYCLWWIPVGHVPAVAEGRERLEHYQKQGATSYSFWFSQHFPQPADEGVCA